VSSPGPATEPQGKDHSAVLQEVLEQAAGQRQPLQILGSGSKAFYGREPAGTPICVAEHRGIIGYEPSELVLTARAGTPLHQIKALLAENRQMLAFEPPSFGPAATLGGAVASGLSGPRRPYSGALRDFVLGVRVINGQGQVLRFGGEVMKNVAGYDVSRLMSGALGTLGLLLEISLKVLPAPQCQASVARQVSQRQALEIMNTLACRPLPLSAACWDGGLMRLRFSGSQAGVDAALKSVAGDRLSEPDADVYWRGLREQTLPFFAGDGPLWRLSVAPATAPLAGHECLVDWGGGLRWLRSNLDPGPLQALAAEAGGHACLFRNGNRHGQVFQPLATPLFELHKRIKAVMDPAGILNPGRMFEDV